MRLRALLVSLSILALLGGCAGEPHRAPVSERAPARKAGEPDWRPQTHTVKKGETMYSIALEYGLDYKDLAELNGISAPYRIRVGQQLRVGPKPEETVSVQPLGPVATVGEGKPLGEAASPAPGEAPPSSVSRIKTGPKATKIPYSVEAETAPVVVAKTEPAAPKPAPVAEAPKAAERKAAPASADESKPAASNEEDGVEWMWPAKGKVIASFNEGANLKGVDISGKAGQPVFASAAGKVVYSGSGLRGYGKLVIIKHNKTYLSAYAHNSQILVKEGQTVVKGQRIAEMGNTDADQVKLHFEIRRLGKPVDPIKLLPGNNG